VDKITLTRKGESVRLLVSNLT